jgi:subtilisin family serine protease
LIGAALSIPVQAAAALTMNPTVERIEEDQEATAFALAAVKSWGQNCVDQCALPLSTDTTFNRMITSDGRVYVINTGTYAGHIDFANLIGPQDCHKSYYSTSYFPPTNGNSHGTHIASTMCGHKYGIVACKELCAVKVLDNGGSGSYSNVIARVDFVAGNCNFATTSRKCVANMSLGGGRSTSMDTTVTNAINKGVTFVNAARNSNANACNYSPAAAGKAITVGATNSSNIPALFTN